MTTRHSRRARLRRLSIALAAAAIAACGPAAAQFAARPLPTTKEVTAGIAIVDAPKREGSRERDVFAAPWVTGRWSNGLFATIGRAGWNASSDPTLDYGPLLALSVQERRDDDPGDSRDRPRFRILGGGFVRWMFSREVYLRSDLLYGGGDRRRGLQATVGADFGFDLASHHTLWIRPEAVFANAAYMAPTFGVTAEQSRLDGFAPYRAGAGLKSLELTAVWSWEASRKWDFDFGAGVDHLVGSAARSPLTRQRTAVTATFSAGYHF